MHDEPGDGDTDVTLPAGRHEVIVVGAEWSPHRDGERGDGAARLDVECTFTTGPHKGAVVTIGLPVGSAAFTRLLALLGRADAATGDEGVVVAALAFPCTLVAGEATDGRLAVTFDP